MSHRHYAVARRPIPARAGIGLRAPHYREILERAPDVGFLEVHSENYFGDGGPPLEYLEALRVHYPLSLHGVGLSIGSTDPRDLDHLRRLARLIGRFEPGLVSEHLCWGSVDGTYLNDLLPLPYTEEALAHVIARIAEVQDRLGRRILIENVSSYLRFTHSTIPEWEFLDDVAKQSGCAILLDINNIYVSACNHNFDPYAYLDSISADAVLEMHLAGFAVNRYDAGAVYIDNHGARVAEPVWRLYQAALARFGPLPTLIEWDTELPPLDVLLDEAARAEFYIGDADAVAA